jgi:nucleotide-binding universal stress UspA family protein
MTGREILVGMDGSANSAAALRWALAEADLRGASATALHAWGHTPPGHAGGGHIFDADFGAGEADAALRAAIAAAAGQEAGEAVARRVVCSPPTKALLASATGADLVVVGARGAGGFRGLLLGSVSEQCLHHATGPLAIVRGEPSEGGTAGRVVVGVDGSDSSGRALHWALEEARLRRACLDVVHAWQPPYVVPAPYTGMPLDPEPVENAAKELLDRVLDREDLARQPAPVERIAVRGSPPRAILETALGADLVILGSRGLGGFAGLLLGSVTHHVAHHASCPLVVVP